MMKGYKMKNIVIINHHATIPKYGGGGRHHQFSIELSKRDFNVTLIGSSYLHGTKEYLHDAAIMNDSVNENYEFNMIRTVPAYKSDMKKRLLNYMDFKNKVGNYDLTVKPDVIIASSVHPFAWIAGYKLAKKYGAKFVVEVRDLWPLSLYEDLDKRVRPVVFSYFNRLEKKYYNLASSIIVTAPNADKYMNKKYNIDKNKVHFIPHSINIGEFDSFAERTISKPIKQLLDKYFCITYTGSLSKSEGLENFIYIAEKFKTNEHLKFIIVGSGTEKPRLDRLVDEFKLNNVHMFERLPREDIPSILCKSSVLFAGLMERKAFKYGISKNKFYDYMAAKKPVIFMSNVEDSAIENANCGFVIKKHSINEAADKLSKLYKNKELYDTLSENGRKYVENNHTIEVITDQLIKAIY